MTIATHTSPDLDAIGGCWLLQRYSGMTEHEIVFVNTGNPDPALLADAAAVVDTGREYDPARLRFDHHHLPGTEANATCATLQVAQHLVLARPDVDFTPIWPLVDLIFAGDTGRAAANESRSIGIHALLSAQKARKLDDANLLTFGYGILDLLAEHLHARAAARATLATHTIYRSDDGLVVALKDAPQGATFAAMEAGAQLVVFANYEQHAIGVMRQGEWQEPHCGELTALVGAGEPLGSPIERELRTWFRHEAGFFAGRGTAKAPREDPILVDLVDVARAIDRAWRR